METCDRKSCGRTLGVTRWVLKLHGTIYVLCSPECYTKEIEDEKKRRETLARMVGAGFNGS